MMEAAHYVSCGLQIALNRNGLASAARGYYTIKLQRLLWNSCRYTLD